MCAENQSRFNELLKQFHHRQDVLRIDAERIHYASLAAKLSIWEHYAKGKISLIFNVESRPNGQSKREIAAGSKPNHVAVPGIILKLDAAADGVVEHWNQKAVFISNVELVNGPDGKIPSVVGLYLIEQEFEKSLTCNVYFSLLKRSFQTFKCGMTREFDISVGALGSDSLKRREPRIIESAFHVMDGVSDHHSHVIGQGIHILDFIFKEFISSAGIDLDCSSASFLQRENSCFNLRDMLIGPFDFESGTLVNRHP
jgi:hypothetical protein